MARIAPDYAERRADARVPAREPVRAYLSRTLDFWADCELRDVSAGGAKIFVSAVYKLPPRFILLQLQAGIANEVVLKWQRGDLAGVSFERRHHLADSHDPAMAAVKAAWIALQPR